MALRCALERVITASGSGFRNWQWRLATLTFEFGGLGVYSAAYGSTFDDALWPCGNLKGRITLRVVSISGLGQAMNGKNYRCVLCNRIGVPLFSVSKSCSACSKVFARDTYGGHVVSCAGILGGKEVDIRLSGGCHKALRPTDRLLYSWDVGLDVCVDLIGSSPLTQTGMANFVPGRVVIDAAHRKHSKYMAKCAAIGYGFLPFSFSSLRELEADMITLLKRIQKFSMTQDIR
nr:hypothetical protein [Tanacetum cinerariifolium]